MTGGSEGGGEGLSGYCLDKKASYHERFYYEKAFNWCPVPAEGMDAILFAAVAVAVACLAQGRYSNSIILLVGAAVQGFVLPYNLGRFGNGVALWLGIQPYELFFYIFLPPLLLDAAVRIDFYLFKKVIVQVITLAFLVVGGSVGFMIPIMLYVLDLKSSGWNWQYVSLFISMLASTDAVAIIATMKTSGGPKRLRVLLEGEALLNDASSFTLFEIFLHLVESYNGPAYHEESGWSVFGDIIKQALKLGFGGLGVGLAFGIACRYVLRFMRYMGASIDQQVSLTLALAYLSYYVANSPCAVSGVVSVACFGLYGAATSKWDMSAKVEESGAFDAFWDTLSFVCNGIVFFFSGVACINFFVRSSEQLDHSSHGAVLASTIWRLPLIYIFMFVARFVLTTAFRPMFKIFLGDMGWKETIFATAAGLRGSVSLILAQAVVVDSQTAQNDTNQVIKSEIVLWTAGFVLMTLLINGSFLPLILRKTGLSKVSEGKTAMRKRATKALASHTTTVLDHLKADEDEMLRGVDWDEVEGSTNVCGGVYCHFLDPTKLEGGDRPAWWQRALNAFCCCFQREGKAPKTSDDPPRKLLGEGNGLGGAHFFGRTRGWGESEDLETGFFEDGDDFLKKTSSSAEDESQMNEDTNELTVGSEFPFLGRHSTIQGDSLDSQKLKRSSTFAGPAKLDRDFKMGPANLQPDPRSKSAEATHINENSLTSRPTTMSSDADNMIRPLKNRTSYVVTNGVLMLAPYDPQEPSDESNKSTSQEEPAPQLRISGSELKKLMQEGTTESTWPKLQKQTTRPPLPFKKSNVPSQPASRPLSPMGSQELNEQSNRTWTAGRQSSPTTSLTRGSGTGPGGKKRPSIFDAFDIEKPNTGMAQKTVAKHRNLYEAFGVTDATSSLGRQQGSGLGNRLKSDFSNASPQSTWTAGMTRGSDPSDLLNALNPQRGTRETTNESPRSIARPFSDPPRTVPEGDMHPADILSRGSRDGGNLSRPPPLSTSPEITSQDSRDLQSIAVTNPTEAVPFGGIMSESEVVESRIRLIGGMKRYFHGKRVEGLLSSSALRILDTACDACIEDPISIEMWENVEKDATGAFWLRWLAQQTYFWRKVILALRRRKSSDYRLFLYTRRCLAWPLIQMVKVLHHVLTKRMLIGIEVGIEYMLALTYSPHVHILRRHERASIVIDEVHDEVEKVWKFIMDREVEAPERFRAIQTYRATMAVLKQQAAFVKSMYNSGVVDDMEEAELLRPIEGRERTLERKGPRYKSPTTLQILHNLPFLRRVPDFITEVLYRHGKLHQYRSGTSLPCGKTKSMFVVTSGILKVSYTDPQGLAQEYFLASGGILNLYSAMTGEALPGKVEAIAEGNALGRGPVVVEFYKSGVDLIRKQALAGDQYYVQIELDLMRLAAIYLTERMKPRLMPFIFTRLSQQFAKQPKQTLPRLHSLLSDDSRFDQDVFPDSGRQKEDMQGMVREAAVQEYTNMRHDLACSEILTLHAGSAYLQRSHMVLLRGTLKVAGQSAPGSPTGGRRDSGVLEYKAPFVFTYIAPSEGEPQNPTRFVAGYHSEQREAVLMVCTPKSGEAIIVTEPEEVGARKSFEGVENEKAPDLKSKTASSSNKSRPPNLRRQSLALILNAGDTGEVSSAQRRKSKQWWDHATRAKLEQRDV